MSPKTWHAPRFWLSEEKSGEAPRTHSPPEGVELVPRYDGQTWVLQEVGKQRQEINTEVARLEISMHSSIGRFLEGWESECEDESSDEKHPGDADEL